MTARRPGEGRAPALRQMVHAHSRRPMPAPFRRHVDALEPHAEQMKRPERGCSDGPFCVWGAQLLESTRTQWRHFCACCYTSGSSEFSSLIRRPIGSTQGNGNMDRLEKLENGLEARRKALIEELGLVNAAIREATSAMEGSENSTRWLQKLDKWHEELHTLVERLPKRHE
jgi:hypothetical protein